MRARPLIALPCFAVLISVAPSTAQSTCLPADSNSDWLLQDLRSYATDSSGGFATTSLHLPLLTTAQANSQVVLVSNDSLCAIASREINSSIVTVDSADDNPARPVYVFLFADLYMVQTLRHGLLSAIEIYDSNWKYLVGFGWQD